MIKFKKYNSYLLLIIGILLIVTIFSSCDKKETLNGSFVIKDGEETYVIDGKVYGNRLVTVDDKLYYVDENGHKIKSEWAVIDNDGHYGYFGNFGELIVDKVRTIDGKDYYFDENGILYQDRTEKQIKIIDGIKYIANKQGELRIVNDETEKEEIKQTTNTTTTHKSTTSSDDFAKKQSQLAAEQARIIASQQAAIIAMEEASKLQSLQQTTQNQISNEAPFSNAINITNNTPIVDEALSGPGATTNTNTNSKVSTTTNKTTNQTTAQTTAQTTTQTSNEIKIVSTEKVTDVIEGDDYDCNITLLKPIMNGSTVDETQNMNSCIDELMDAWFDEINGLVSDYDDLPKSVTFSNATLGTVSKTKIYINITGSLKPKSGSSKSLKYRITYDREDINADIDKMN